MTTGLPVGTGSALPAWLQEILPSWFTARPALTEALYTFSRSLWHYTIIIGSIMLGDAYTDHSADTLSGLVHYFATHWLIALVGYVVGSGLAGQQAVRAHNKAVAAETP